MLNLHSLERHRLRGDLIQVLKWYRGYNKGVVSKILRISSQDRTRNNGFKIEKSRNKKEIGKNWFTDRVVDEWNGLSRQVVSAKTIESFKRRLYRYRVSRELRYILRYMIIQVILNRKSSITLAVFLLCFSKN